jgi:hypothetical protein
MLFADIMILSNNILYQPDGWTKDNLQKLFTEETSEQEKVCFVLQAINECLKKICPESLTTINDWCKLYSFLCRKHGLKVTQNPPMHPRTFFDLVYKTKLLFQSLHKLRFAFIEGQKRTLATTLFLIGHVPSQNLTCHLNLKPEAYEVQNVKFLNIDSDIVKVSGEANKILKKFNVEVEPSYTEVVRGDGEGLSERAMAVYRELSRRMAQQNNSTQTRGWKTIISAMLGTTGLIRASLPYELYPDTLPKEDDHTLKAYHKDYRSFFLRTILVDKTTVDIKNSFTTQLGVLSTDSLIRNLLDRTKVKCLREFTIDLKHPPMDDKLVYIMMTLITSCVTDQQEAKILSNVLSCDGKRSSDRIYSEKLIFAPNEMPKNTTVEVSRFLSLCEYTIIRLPGNRVPYFEWKTILDYPSTRKSSTLFR